MRSPLARVPWHTGAPAFLVCAVALAFAANLFGGDYFKRTFLEEANAVANGADPAGTPATHARASHGHTGCDPAER